jgi:hypothetical protein
VPAREPVSFGRIQVSPLNSRRSVRTPSAGSGEPSSPTPRAPAPDRRSPRRTPLRPPPRCRERRAPSTVDDPICATRSAPPDLRHPICATRSAPPDLRHPICATRSAPLIAHSAVSENSVVRAMSIMYVRCVSDLVHKQSRSGLEIRQLQAFTRIRYRLFPQVRTMGVQVGSRLRNGNSHRHRTKLADFA